MKVKVKANNNYNKSAGIEQGKIYEAEKIIEKMTEPTIYKEEKYLEFISYTINDINYDSFDFTEIA